MDEVDLLVLGAGPAGIGAAQRAARAGHHVTVVDRGDAAGGTSGSYEVAGIRVDHGSHRLHRSIEPRILAELDRLLGDDLQVRERRGRIRLADRWLAFPLRPADLVRNLPPGFAARALWDTLTGPLREPAADTFAEVVRARLGPTMLDRFYGPYAVKLWGLPPEELAGEQARRRISADSPAKLVQRVLAGTDPEARTFRYPRRGFGQVWEALADDAAAAGADVRLRTEVTGIRQDTDALVVTTDRGTLRAQQVFNTLPLPLLARMWQPTPPDEVVAAARALTSRAMVLVHLVVEGAPWTPFDAHYLPESWTSVTRISEPRNYRDDPAEPADRTVLTAEIPCAVGDATWTAGDDELAEVVTDAIAHAGLPAPRLQAVETRRLPAAYPILVPGTAARVERLEQWASARPHLLTFGRHGLFVHDNSHHALSMAWAAVDALGSPADVPSVDGAAWARSRAGFRSHVVED